MECKIVSQVVLVANPGSASRKYAVYHGDDLLADVHFELVKQKVVYTLSVPDHETICKPAGISHLTFSATKLLAILQQNNIIEPMTTLNVIGLRIVAPSTYFQQHRRMDKIFLKALHNLQHRAPLHISASLQEVELLSSVFPGVPIIGASDSAFHSNKPAIAHSYAIPQKDAQNFDIWRFGYHGLSLSSVAHQLKTKKFLSKNVIVCHLGSGASVTALHNGQSIDSTMGYSPLEGLMMSTRCGSIDPTAVEILRTGLGMTRSKTQNYLNLRSGLLGVSGKSDDIRELLELESAGNKPAKFALDMYVLRVQQAIGQMVATLGGIDTLVFTGTVGERSSEIRKRVCNNLSYLGLRLSSQANHKVIEPNDLTTISEPDSDKNILVVPSDEARQIADIATDTFS